MTFKQHYTYIEEQYILEEILKITGPALFYKPDKVMVDGPIGTSHFMLYSKLAKALAKKRNISEHEAEQIIDQVEGEDELIAGFKTTQGGFVNRAQAWEIVQKYKQGVKPRGQFGQVVKSLPGPPELASEYL